MQYPSSNYRSSFRNAVKNNSVYSHLAKDYAPPWSSRHSRLDRLIKETTLSLLTVLELLLLGAISLFVGIVLFVALSF